jgi:hypothetical protein
MPAQIQSNQTEAFAQVGSANCAIQEREHCEILWKGKIAWPSRRFACTLGRLLAGPDYSGEQILTADLDPGEIAEGKFDLDVTGHYARPDVFRLEVNEKARF